MEIIILAGGLGTRLKSVTGDNPKVMAPVKGRPFLCLLLDMLINNGADRIIFALSYKASFIRDYFGDLYRGLPIVYSVEDKPLGTGGAIRQALGFCYRNTVGVVNGDTFFEVNIAEQLAYHKKNNAEITIAAKPMEHFDRFGTITEENGRITAFHEKKPMEKGLINGGVYILNRNVFDGAPAGTFSFEKEILEKLNHRVFAFQSTGFFLDIGIPADYFLSQTAIPLCVGDSMFKAAFLDRDGTLCIEKHHLYKPEELEFIDGSEKAIARLHELGYLVIIVTNQAGVAKGLYKEQDVQILHNAISQQLLAAGTYADAFYYCPHHPEATVEAFRKDCPCRKPGPGMIERAIEDFSGKGIKISREGSFMAGDTEKDITAGTGAHLGKKILLLSGHTKTAPEKTEADKIVKNLWEYVKSLPSGSSNP